MSFQSLSTLFLRQGPSLKLQLTNSARLSSVSLPHALGSQQPYPTFIWELRIQIQVLSLVQEVSYSLSHFPSFLCTSFSACLPRKVEKILNFCMLILFADLHTLLKVFFFFLIRCKSFLVEPEGSLTMTSYHLQISIIQFLFFLFVAFSLFLIIPLAKTRSTVLHECRKCRHPYLLPYFGENAFCMVLAILLLYASFVVYRHAPSVSCVCSMFTMMGG